MFTGIVEDIATISSIESAKTGRKLSLKTLLPLQEIKLGDSISVDGVCLTVVAKANQTLHFDVSQESVARSTLGKRKQGDKVHLERAMQLGGRLGGHLVQGHVDATGTIEKLSPLGEAMFVEVSCPKTVGNYLIDKGSIAIDGVSLTVNEQKNTSFSIVLVPHTLEKTIIARKGIGALVNLEIDLIAKYVEKLLVPQSNHSGINLQFLRTHGFAPTE